MGPMPPPPNTKILIVLGTRPEAIKLAPVILDVQNRPGAEARVCLTGQHREMVASILSFFRITADRDLDVMRPNQPLSALAARSLAGLDEVLTELLPDWTVVQGDTTTAFAAALASFHRHVLVMRDVTERRESVDAGGSRLVGTSRSVIQEWTLRLLRDDATYRQMARKVDVYGDGHASERISTALGLAGGGVGPRRLE